MIVTSTLLKVTVEVINLRKTLQFSFQTDCLQTLARRINDQCLSISMQETVFKKTVCLRSQGRSENYETT